MKSYTKDNQLISHFLGLDLWTRIRMVLGILFLLLLAAAAIFARFQFVESIRSIKTLVLFLTVFILVWGLCFVLIFQHPSFEEGLARKVNAVYLVCVPLYIFLTVEMVTANSSKNDSLPVKIFGDTIIKPRFIFVNLLLICLVLAILIFVTNSIRVGSELCGAILILFAIINIYVNNFRGTAITAADIAVMTTALEVAGNYVPKMHIRVFQGLVNLLLLLIVAGRLSHTRVSRRAKYYLFNVLGAGAGAAALFYVIFSGFLVSYKGRLSYYNTMRYGYRQYGCVFTFARTISDAFPQKPAGYSLSGLQEIADRYDSGEAVPAAGVSESNPNIIIIVNEAFSDLHELGDFETTENELSFFDSLTENCISGIAYSSVKGGRTANTEYEILTGHSMANLPYGTVPFQLYIKHQLPSLASILAQEDYAGLFAFHPCPKKNYNRINAYPFLGFETFYNNQDVPLYMSKIHRYYSDRSCYNNLLAICNQIRSSSDQPIFAYNMTIQNHSPYDTIVKNFTPSVHADDLSKVYADVDTYLTLMKISDTALRLLIGRLEALNEPTLVLFVGDHQPSLDDSFYDEVIESSDRLIDYRVPFKIWANYDIEEQTGIVTSMNYLQTYLLDACGGRKTGFQQFLTELREDIPVITGNGYIGENGRFYNIYNTNSPYYEQLQEYAFLQYNALFDKGNMLDDFFEFAD